MTRKDYELVARQLAAFSTIEGGAPVKDVTAEIAAVLAMAFKRDNPKFNSAVFLKACQKEAHS